MATNRSIALAAYVAIAIFVLFPIMDTLSAVLPANPGDIAWRYGAAGLVSRILPDAVLGLLLALIVAISLQHGRVRRGLGLASLLFALVLVGIWVIFFVDSARMGPQLVGAARAAAETATTVALVKFGLASFAAVLLARAALDPRA
jgi:hypothetical protein